MYKVTYMKPLLLTAKKRLVLHVLSLVLIGVSALFSTAKAGDIAARNIIGFSPDGAYFAFEEYGVQDGSGFPYANIYFSNTRENSWVKGSPIRVLIQDEQTDLATAREQAATKAAPLIAKYKIKSGGQLLAHNPVTELNRPTDEVTVAPGKAPFLQKYALTFNVKEMPLETKRCKDYGPEAQNGYVLTATRNGRQKAQTLHKDNRIPTSRRCPKRYAISDVIRFVDPSDSQKALYIVLLQVFSYGFEGDDGRYLATSHWLPSYNASN